MWKSFLVVEKEKCLNFPYHPSKCLYYLSGSCRNRRKNRKFLERADFWVLRFLSTAVFEYCGFWVRPPKMRSFILDKIQLETWFFFHSIWNLNLLMKWQNFLKSTHIFWDTLYVPIFNKCINFKCRILKFSKTAPSPHLPCNKTDDHLI